MLQYPEIRNDNAPTAADSLGVSATAEFLKKSDTEKWKYIVCHSTSEWDMGGMLELVWI